MESNNNPSLENFSIQDTMDMGMGSQELINDLFAPETATSNPADLTPIVAQVEDKPAPAAPTVKVVEINDDPGKKEGPSGQSLISDFLGKTGLEEEEEEELENEPPANKTAPTKKVEEEESAPQGTQFTALANDLFNLGVFTKEENEGDVSIESPEQFLERFQSEKKKGAIEIVDNFIGQFGEDYQNAFDAIFVKGVSPKEYFGVYNSIVNYSELDLTVEDNQVKVMKQALHDQGFEAEDIETEIERLKNYGDLESVSQRHHKVLIKKDSQRLQQLEADAERELQQKAQIRNQYVTNVNNVIQEKLKTKEFDGIPINPKLAGEIQDFLLTDKWKTNSGETLTDFDRTILDLKRPENHAMKVKVALLLKILEKDPSLSTIQKTGITKKSDQLFSEVAKQVTSKSTGSAPNGTSPSRWFKD